MANQPHILKPYEDALAGLRAKVEAIAAAARRNLAAATAGVLQGDAAQCLRAIVDDEEVNALEKAIDAAGIEILTRFQPVAGDLRFVIAALRLATNLERISDEAKNIARRGRQLAEAGAEAGPGPDFPALPGLFAMADAELAGALAAFFANDGDRARDIRRQDKELDRSHKELIAAISGRLAANPAGTTRYLAILFIVRSLERIGDHAKNIAEESVFLTEARDIRYSKNPLATDPD
jgi:phosphate transport system protein